MATFPTAVFAPRTTENLPGVSYDPTQTKEVYAEDYSLPAAEIAAIETILGTNPQGVYATVKAWLTALAGAVSNAVTTDQTVGQTIGATGARLTKLWATDITVTNTIAGTTSGNLVSGGALGTPSSGTATHITGLPAAAVLAGTLGTGAYTIDTSLAVPQIFNADHAITASGNAATVTRAYRNNVVTNNSAATITITLSTTSATGGDMVLVQVLPSSAAAQTITWVNTENSTVTAPVLTNATTTNPVTVGFKWNPLTSLWKCIASA